MTAAAASFAEAPTCPGCGSPGVLMKGRTPGPPGARLCFDCDQVFGWEAPIVTAEQAIDARRELMAGAGAPGELREAVEERLAIRAPEGNWLVLQCPRTVRLFVKTTKGHLSRYVWRRGDVDGVIDQLEGAASARGAQ